MTGIQLTEAAELLEATGGKRRFRARLIAGDIQGSSGYYPAEMLRRCAGVFEEGLPVFLDHPSMSEAVERPERSVRDLAGRLASNAVYEGDGLYADVEVYPHYAPVIEALASDIGMSIRACGTTQPSTTEGMRGPIVTSLTEAMSVDFVTAAGAGGKIVQLLESARQASGDTPPEDRALREAATVGTWLESRIHLLFTEIADNLYGNGYLTRAERIGCSTAIGEGLAAFTSRIEADFPQLYQRGRWQEPEAEQAAMAEASTPTQPAPAPEPNTGIEPTNKMKEGSMPEITEEQAKQLAESATVRAELEKAQAKLAESEQTRADSEKAFTERLDAMEARLTEAQARNAETEARNLALENDRQARSLVAEALKGSGLLELAHARVTESVCRVLPTGEDGRLDTAKLTEATTAAIDSEKTYLAGVAEASGAGTPRGLAPQPAPLTDADIDAQLTEAFAGIGLNEAQARTAATGR